MIRHNKLAFFLLKSSSQDEDQDRELTPEELNFLNLQLAAIAQAHAKNPPHPNDFRIYGGRFAEPPPTCVFDTDAGLSASEVLGRTRAAFETDTLLSPTVARKFINNLWGGEFAKEDPILHARGLEELSIKQKLILYESIAQEVNPRNLQYLGALNEVMGLSADFYDRQAQQAAGFLSQGNLNESPLLQRSLHRFLENPVSPSEKQKLMNNILDAYCDFCGLARMPLRLINEKENLLGYYNPPEQGRGQFIAINTNSRAFANDPMTVLETLFHEAQHAKQQKLADDYKSGKIKPSDPDYLAARVFHANINTAGGYIGANTNYDHYFAQAAEVDARGAGDAARKKLGAMFAPTQQFTPTMQFTPRGFAMAA